jgi:intracellular septation protein A
MNFDLRLPLGIIFSLFGIILVVYGWISDPAIYHRSLGFNVNLDWGCVLLAFGLFMLRLALRARRRH